MHPDGLLGGAFTLWGDEVGMPVGDLEVVGREVLASSGCFQLGALDDGGAAIGQLEPFAHFQLAHGDPGEAVERPKRVLWGAD
nr:hypothetical protein [Persicirhabdus sediminis]